MVIGRPPIDVLAPGRSPAPAVPSVIAMIPRALGGERHRTIAGMDVNAVADELRGQRLALENRGHEARLAVVERRHPIEKVRGMARRRRRSPPAPASYVAPECPSETQMPCATSWRIRSIAPSISGAMVMIPTSSDAAWISVRISAPDEVALGLSVRWQAQALERLGPAVLGIDEVALEVRRQHASAGGCFARGANCGQHRLERRGRAGHRRRAEAP